MPDLLAGTIVRGLDTPQTVYLQDTTPNLAVANTDYQPGIPEVGVTFTAPTTGRVKISVGASMRNDAANTDRVAVTVQVFQTNAGGIEVLAPTVFRGVCTDGIASPSNYCTTGHTSLLTDLTPGQQYYARCMQIKFGTAGTTPDIAMRDILVEPAT
ncbi:hypothetical protein ACFYO0_14640 [Streptomyces sp. NPDC006365]|uniref:hypothetical protein n=1 Tax=Streptomyces sp. NPDC006365 TaxID=3364744 RepID=UPI0036A655B3